MAVAKTQGSLAQYPQLARWFQEQSVTPPSAREPAALLLFRTCAVFAEAGSDGVTPQSIRHWLEHFQAFMQHSTDVPGDFRTAEHLAQRLDADLMSLIGDLGEAAVRGDGAAAFLKMMQSGAEQTGLAVLRFLAAWTALNTGHLALCVEECEKVDAPFGAVFILQGQALLEMGKAADARDALNIGVKLAPAEPLAWFQLAKAHHVLGEFDLALNALRECRRYAPQSDEVAVYMGMIALEADGAPQLGNEALHALQATLRRCPDNAMIVFTLLKLAAKLDNKAAARLAISAAQWPSIALCGDFASTLAPALRLLQTAGWMDIASEVLSELTPGEGLAS